MIDRKFELRFTLGKNKDNVILEVGPCPVDAKLVYFFRCNVNDKNYANLLLEYLRTNLGELMANERRVYYERGWKDAKAKKRKRDNPHITATKRVEPWW